MSVSLRQTAGTGNVFEPVGTTGLTYGDEKQNNKEAQII